jgi:hypothetical protein
MTEQDTDEVTVLCYLFAVFFVAFIFLVFRIHPQRLLVWLP